MIIIIIIIIMIYYNFNMLHFYNVLRMYDTMRGHQFSQILVAKLLPVPSATGQVPIRINFLNAFRNSGLNIVQMTGFTKLFMYPSHVVNMNMRTPGEHSLSSLLQIASRMLHVKNGTQQNRNTPETCNNANPVQY